MKGRLIFLGLGVLMGSVASAQIQLNAPDTFTDLTIANWSGGANPTVIAGGGPGGASDAFLQFAGTGTFGPGSHATTYNSIQWTGDWSATGVKIVQMDLKNFGPNTSTMRLVFFDNLGNQWTTTNANSPIVPAGSAWTKVTYLIQESGFVSVSGIQTWPNMISGVAKFMIRNNVGSPTSNGTSSALTIGIDNVVALDAFPTTLNNYTLDQGLAFGGNLNSLKTSDNDSVVILNDENDPNGQLTINASTTFLTPSAIKTTIESGASRTDLSEFVELKRFSNNTFTQSSFRSTTLADTAFSGTISTNATQYLSSGALQARIRFIPQADIDAGDGWVERVDLFRIGLLP